MVRNWCRAGSWKLDGGLIPQENARLILTGQGSAWKMSGQAYKSSYKTKTVIIGTFQKWLNLTLLICILSVLIPCSPFYVRTENIRSKKKEDVFKKLHVKRFLTNTTRAQDDKPVIIGLAPFTAWAGWTALTYGAHVAYTAGEHRRISGQWNRQGRSKRFLSRFLRPCKGETVQP